MNPDHLFDRWEDLKQGDSRTIFLETQKDFEHDRGQNILFVWFDDAVTPVHVYKKILHTHQLHFICFVLFSFLCIFNFFRFLWCLSHLYPLWLCASLFSLSLPLSQYHWLADLPRPAQSQFCSITNAVPCTLYVWSSPLSVLPLFSSSSSSSFNQPAISRRYEPGSAQGCILMKESFSLCCWLCGSSLGFCLTVTDAI